MLKLKLQYFGHLIWRTDSLEKTLMLEKIEGRKRRGWQRIRWVDGIIDSMNMSSSRFQEIVKDSLACCRSGGCKEPDTSEWPNNNNLYGTSIHMHYVPSCLPVLHQFRYQTNQKTWREEGENFPSPHQTLVRLFWIFLSIRYTLLAFYVHLSIVQF